jgi:hypothetical protein
MGESSSLPWDFKNAFTLPAKEQQGSGRAPVQVRVPVCDVPGLLALSHLDRLGSMARAGTTRLISVA